MKVLVSALLLLFAAISPSFACDRTSGTNSGDETTEAMLARTVFNRITPESMEIDAAAKKAYGCRYIFADVFGGLERAEPTSGRLPEPPIDSDGKPITGRVLVAYIITVDGLAKDPVVIESTDPRLTSVALAAMQGWRFKPANFNGRPVATLAAQEFQLTAPEA